jgi:hypothetical protein
MPILYYQITFCQIRIDSLLSPCYLIYTWKKRPTPNLVVAAAAVAATVVAPVNKRLVFIIKIIN